MKFYRIGCLIREAVNQAIAPLLPDGIDVCEVVKDTTEAHCPVAVPHRNIQSTFYCLNI